MAFFSLNLKNKIGDKKSEKGWTVKPTFSRQPLCEDPSGPSQLAIIYQSELDFISQCILDYPNIETGGELFGFWTQLGTPVVLYAVGPGPNARHHPTSFIQDSAYVDNIEVELCNRTGLQHIGQWHSHHRLSLAHPSQGDVASMQRGVGLPGFPRMLLCIGNCTYTDTTINAFNFHENTPGRYVHAAWKVIRVDSPFRASIHEMFGHQLYKPRTLHASHSNEMHIVSPPSSAKKMPYRQHWLTLHVDNVELMKDFLKTAGILFSGSEPSAEILNSGEPLISLYSGQIKIVLPYGFPEVAPQFMIYEGKMYTSTHSLNINATRIWNHIEGPLDIKFYNWLELVQPHPERQQQQSLFISTSKSPQTSSSQSNPRLVGEIQELESLLSTRHICLKETEMGEIILEAQIPPLDTIHPFTLIQVARDAEFNFKRAKFKMIISDRSQSEQPYRDISDLSPLASEFIQQKISASTPALEIYKFMALLIHHAEKAAYKSQELDFMLKRFISDEKLYSTQMEEENLLLEKHFQ